MFSNCSSIRQLYMQMKFLNRYLVRRY